MISVIIPTFNNEDTIVRAMNSVACQTYHDWQIVIVNDASTDKTMDIISQQFIPFYKEKIKVVVNEKNQGVGISRKIGVDNADGEFVIFLDSDDYILPNCLEMSMMLQEQQNADVIYTSTTIYVDNEHVKNLTVPDFIMEGKISPSLHINYPKKWLTGKMFRTSLMKRVPMSPKRIGEDVNTLFYACYLADKVRSSQYSGYIHLYRQGSLIGMGTDTPFHYYCLSSLCDIEMFEFILDKNDMDVFGKMVSIPYLGYQMHFQEVMNKKVNLDETNESRHNWEMVTKWYTDHKELIENSIRNITSKESQN